MSRLIDVGGSYELDITTVAPEAAAIITEARRLQLDAVRGWLDPALDTEERTARILGLMDRARASAAPDLACAAVAATVTGYPSRWMKALLEEAVTRDVERAREGAVG